MTKELGYTPITGDQVLKMTPEEIAAQQFQAWVESRVWVFAKTMPEHRHFYTATNRKRDDAETIARFEDAVIFVRLNGIRRRFVPSGSRFLYFDHTDGLSYWTIGWPPHQTVVMNRAPFDPVLHVAVKPRAPKREYPDGLSES